ncbi:hypothetical protein A2U01_0095128 [Trifolium medium]|uniref:Uncharacterized protein n=1 Tax=Trifolium medium TaxID=97028 RepID=A0A392UMI8_9FABA|nr:hypothetical protein [Trifolium medium]
MAICLDTRLVRTYQTDPLETCQALADPHAESDPHPPPPVARYHEHHLAPLPPRVSKGSG